MHCIAVSLTRDLNAGCAGRANQPSGPSCMQVAWLFPEKLVWRYGAKFWCCAVAVERATEPCTCAEMTARARRGDCEP